jgi:hypothetical protein
MYFYKIPINLVILALNMKGACFSNVVKALCYNPEGRGFKNRFFKLKSWETQNIITIKSSWNTND